MAAFSPATFQSVIDELVSGFDELVGHLNRVGPATNAATSHWWMPEPVARGLVWCANKLIELGNSILEKIGELLQGAAAPVTFFFRAADWRDSIGAPASLVAGSIAPTALRAPLDWTGDAAARYTRAVAGQAPAATAVETLSTTVATALTTSAAAGCAFYVALGVIIVKLIIATVAAIAALGSVVFSWAGVLLIIEEAGVNTAMIIAAVSLLTACLAAQAAAIVTVSGGAASSGAFPGGQWPVGTA
ncbi:MAG: hypothetical protein JWP95_527 [Actinotalea sp.]|nr:hypothetical protein [Actinotalea sp.]